MVQGGLGFRVQDLGGFRGAAPAPQVARLKNAPFPPTHSEDVIARLAHLSSRACDFTTPAYVPGGEFNAINDYGARLSRLQAGIAFRCDTAALAKTLLLSTMIDISRAPPSTHARAALAQLTACKLLCACGAHAQPSHATPTTDTAYLVPTQAFWRPGAERRTRPLRFQVQGWAGKEGEGVCVCSASRSLAGAQRATHTT